MIRTPPLFPLPATAHLGLRTPPASDRIATASGLLARWLPKFQRKFVWKDDQALDLLDSIAINYPVGSLLLWRTKDRLLAERNIGEFSLPATDDMEPTDYVLDGQQRLAVIYSCLGAKETDAGFAVVYDLESGKFGPESMGT